MIPSANRSLRSAAMLIVALAVIRCGPQPDGASPEQVPDDGCAQLLHDTSPAELRKGAEIWSVLCAGCHGERGRGGASARLQGIEPPDLTDPERATSFSGEDRMRIIAEGVEGTTMIGWNSVLTENEIVAVYRHLCALMQDAREGSG